MKKLTKMAAIAMMLTFGIMTLQSCTEKAIQTPGVYPEAYPFKENDYNRWGMMTVDGKVIFEDLFNNPPLYAHDGRFFVKDDDYDYKLYSLEKKPRKIGKSWKRVTNFSNGLALVVSDEEPVVIDVDGNVKFKLDRINDKLIIEAYSLGDRSQVFVVISDDGLVGCIRQDGTVAIDPVFKSIYPGNSYIYAFTEESKNLLSSENTSDHSKAMFSLFDGTGNNRRDICCGDVGYIPSGGYYNHFGILSLDKKKHGIADYNGNIIMEPIEVEALKFFFEKQRLIVFQKDDKYGLMDMNHNIVIPAEYDYLQGADEINGLLVSAKITEDKKIETKLLDLQGKEVAFLGTDIEDVGFFYGSVLPVATEDHCYLMNRNGRRERKTYSVIKASIETNTYNYVMSKKEDFQSVLNFLDFHDNGMAGITVETTKEQIKEKMEMKYEDSTVGLQYFTSKSFSYGNVYGQMFVATYMERPITIGVRYDNCSKDFFQTLTQKLRSMGTVKESDNDFFEVEFSNGNHIFISKKYDTYICFSRWDTGIEFMRNCMKDGTIEELYKAFFD